MSSNVPLLDIPAKCVSRIILNRRQLSYFPFLCTRTTVHCQPRAVDDSKPFTRCTKFRSGLWKFRVASWHYHEEQLSYEPPTEVSVRGGVREPISGDDWRPIDLLVCNHLDMLSRFKSKDPLKRIEHVKKITFAIYYTCQITLNRLGTTMIGAEWSTRKRAA